jgi:hypothetical protein
MVWRILCFGNGFHFLSPTMARNTANRDRTDGAMEQRAAANLESKPRMGLYTAASKKVTKKVRSPNDRRWRTVPQHGMALPSAPGKLRAGWRHFRTVK